MALRIAQGKAWTFGDHINTESILMSGGDAEAHKHVLEFYDPEFPVKVQPGDIVVAGRNFGVSSGRPAGQVLKKVGVSCILCRSAAIVFYRNTWNIGLPVLQCPGADQIKKGDELAIDVFTGAIRNLTTGQLLQAEPTPDMLLEIYEHGGLINWIKSRKHLYPMIEA